MNYVCLLKFSLPFWAVISAAVYFTWGEYACKVQSLAFAACLSGGLAAEFLQNGIRKCSTEFTGLVFLLGTLPRMAFPLIFLIFSLKFYHNPMDKFTQFAIIGAYFAYYPLILTVSVCNALSDMK